MVRLSPDRPAYAAADLINLYTEALNPKRPTPGKRGVDVGSWEEHIDRALSLRPDDRFANAGEFLAALESHKATAPEASPAVATPVAASPMPVAPVRDSRGGRAVAFAVGLLLALVVVAFAMRSRG